MSDYFDVLGLPRRYAVDRAELERRYLERSRAVHPDRAVGLSAEARTGAAGQAMQLNQAYRTLKRDLPRAEHLLQLAGVAIGDNQPVAPELLAEVLELREEQADARAAGDRAQLGGDSLTDMEDTESDRLDLAFDVRPESRLGCQAKVGHEDIVVEITPESLKAWLDEHPEVRRRLAG